MRIQNTIKCCLVFHTESRRSREFPAAVWFYANPTQYRKRYHYEPRRQTFRREVRAVGFAAVSPSPPSPLTRLADRILTSSVLYYVVSSGRATSRTAASFHPYDRDSDTSTTTATAKTSTPVCLNRATITGSWSSGRAAWARARWCCGSSRARSASRTYRPSRTRTGR